MPSTPPAGAARAGRGGIARRRPRAVSAALAGGGDRPGCVDGWLPAGATRHEEPGGPPHPGHPRRGARLPGVGRPGRRLERLAPVIAAQPSADELYRTGGRPGPARCSAAPSWPPPCAPWPRPGARRSTAGPSERRSPPPPAASSLPTTSPGARRLGRAHRIDVFSHRFWTVPPNSQGYSPAPRLAAGAARSAGRPGLPAFHHAVIESYRAVAGEADQLVATRGTAPAAGRLLDPERLQPLLASIRPDRAAARPPPSPSGAAPLPDGARRRRHGRLAHPVQLLRIGAGLSGEAPGVAAEPGSLLHAGTGHPTGSTGQAAPPHPLPTLWTRDGRLSLLLAPRRLPSSRSTCCRWRLCSSLQGSDRPRRKPSRAGTSRRRRRTAGQSSSWNPGCRKISSPGFAGLAMRRPADPPRRRLGTGLGHLGRGRRDPRRRRRPRVAAARAAAD